MSRMLIPRPIADGSDLPPPYPPHRPKKISTACGACKARKTRCSGSHPCDACATRNSACVYDATSDQRRKVANQRNIHELETAHKDLDRHRELLGGMIATIKAGDVQATNDLLTLIRSGVDLSQLAAHVRNECRSNVQIQRAFEAIEFIIDGPEELPSPAQVLAHQQPIGDHMQMTNISGIMGEQDPQFENSSSQNIGNFDLFRVDPTL